MSAMSSVRPDREHAKFRQTVSGNTVVAVTSDADAPLSVVVVPSGSNTEKKSFFNTASSVASGIETVVVTYTMPAITSCVLEKVDFGGDNIALYNLYKNGSLINRRRTWFSGPFFSEFSFDGGQISGVPLASGDVVELKVLHSRPLAGNFEGRIQVLETT